MFEFRYAKEPFDFKLFVLCFLKKIWLVPVAMFVGLILVGGCNYLTKVVFGGPVQYEIESSYYVDYYMDPQTGQVYTHYNEATWQSLITTDWFVDRIWEYALALGLEPENYEVEKADLADFLSAALLTDVHIPTTYVTTPNAELTQVLNEAVQLTVLDFGEEQAEILGTRVLDETPLQEKDRDDRTLRACILGAVLGALAAGFGIGFSILTDDSIIVPKTFSYRYGIPMLGALAKGEKELSGEALVNLGYCFRERKKVAVFTVDQVAGHAAKPEGMKEGEILPCNWPEGFEALKADALQDCYETLRQAPGVLLLVEAGVRNGREIEQLLHELAVQEIEVQGALLYGADRKLLKAYYAGRK